MNALEQLFATALFQRTGWSLIHFVWQAALVALLAAGALRLARKRSANVRYALACSAMGMLVALPLLTIWLAPLPGGTEAAAIDEQAPPFVSSPPIAVGNMELEAPAAMVVVVDMPAVVETPAPWHERLAETLAPILPYAVAGWLVGVLGLSMWHAGGWLHVRRLRTVGVEPVAATLAADFAELVGRIGVSRPVQLLQSALVRVPTVVGWLRPVVLVPICSLTELSEDQLRAILAHELAHIRRYDYLVNLLQTVAETLLFYHPAVWWLSGRIRQERENCCDDVAAEVGGDRIVYARTLAAMAELAHPQPRLAVAASGGSLVARISRLIGAPAGGNTRTARWTAGALMLLTAAVIVASAVGVSIAEPSKPVEDSPDKKSIAEPTAQPATQPSTQPAKTRALKMSLRSDLLTIRSQIESYRTQHSGKTPGIDAQGNFDGKLFRDQLTHATNAQGDIHRGGGRRDGYYLGPYIQRMPANPMMKNRKLGRRVMGGPGAPPRDGSSGWWLDTKAGIFYANHAQQSPTTKLKAEKKSPSTRPGKLEQIDPDRTGDAASDEYVYAPPKGKTIIQSELVIVTPDGQYFATSAGHVALDRSEEQFQKKAGLTPATQPARRPYQPTSQIYDIRDLLVRLPIILAADMGGEGRNLTQKEKIEKVIATITETVASESWVLNGGTVGSIRELHGMLLITQTAENHATILELINQWREAVSMKISVEALFISVSPEGEKRLRDWLGQHKPSAPQYIGETPSQRGGWLLSEQEAESLRNDLLRGVAARILTKPRITLFDGHRAEITTHYGSAYQVTVATDDGRKETVTIPGGVSLKIKAAVSTDRRSVVMTLWPTLVNQTGVYVSEKNISNRVTERPVNPSPRATEVLIPDLGVALIPLTKVRYRLTRNRNQIDGHSNELILEAEKAAESGKMIYLMVKPKIILPVEQK